MSRPRMPINHGTPGGYRAHFRHGVPMCDDCRDANRRANGQQPMRYAVCGTRSAYGRHLRRGEEPCGPCREANTADCRADTVARAVRGLAPDDPRHGTENAYSNYRCRCGPCTAVNTAKSARRNARYRQRRAA